MSPIKLVNLYSPVTRHVSPDWPVLSHLHKIISCLCPPKSDNTKCIQKRLKILSFLIYKLDINWINWTEPQSHMSMLTSRYFCSEWSRVSYFRVVSEVVVVGKKQLKSFHLFLSQIIYFARTSAIINGVQRFNLLQHKTASAWIKLTLLRIHTSLC